MALLSVLSDPAVVQAPATSHFPLSTVKLIGNKLNAIWEDQGLRLER